MLTGTNTFEDQPLYYMYYDDNMKSLKQCLLFNIIDAKMSLFY